MNALKCELMLILGLVWVLGQEEPSTSIYQLVNPLAVGLYPTPYASEVVKEFNY
jgi:hypothetical protein